MGWDELSRSGSRTANGTNQRSFISPSPPRRLCRRKLSNQVALPNRLNVGHDIRISIVQLLLSDPTITGIVGGGNQSEITVELPHQRGHEARARRYVLLDF